MFACPPERNPLASAPTLLGRKISQIFSPNGVKGEKRPEELKVAGE